MQPFFAFGVRDNEYDNIYNAMCKQSGVPVYKCKNGVYAVPGSAQMENIEQHLPGGPSLREQMKSYTRITELSARQRLP